MSQTTNTAIPGVRAHPVRVALDRKGDHPSKWGGMVSITTKIGSVRQTLHERVNKAEVDSGKHAGALSEIADRLKLLERKSCD